MGSQNQTQLSDFTSSEKDSFFFFSLSGDLIYPLRLQLVCQKYLIVSISLPTDIKKQSLLSLLLHCYLLSHLQLFTTRWPGAHWAPLSMEFFRQEYCSWLSFPSPEDLPNLGIGPWCPALEEDSLLS